jgi:hypothetical protein
VIDSTAYLVAPRPGLEPGTCGLTVRELMYLGVFI